METFQKQKEKNIRIMFVCAKPFSGDLGLECKFEENKTILKTDHRIMEFRSSGFKQINEKAVKSHLSVREFIVPGKTYLMW